MARLSSEIDEVSRQGATVAPLEVAKACGSSEKAQETLMQSGSLEPHVDGPSVVSVLANLLEAGGDPILSPGC